MINDYIAHKVSGGMSKTSEEEFPENRDEGTRAQKEESIHTLMQNTYQGATAECYYFLWHRETHTDTSIFSLNNQLKFRTQRQPVFKSNLDPQMYHLSNQSVAGCADCDCTLPWVQGWKIRRDDYELISWRFLKNSLATKS